MKNIIESNRTPNSNGNSEKNASLNDFTNQFNTNDCRNH